MKTIHLIILTALTISFICCSKDEKSNEDQKEESTICDRLTYGKYPIGGGPEYSDYVDYKKTNIVYGKNYYEVAYDFSLYWPEGVIQNYSGRIFNISNRTFDAIVNGVSCHFPNTESSTKGEIVGKALDKSNYGIPNAEISTSPATEKVRTDDNGNYVISFVTPGNYLITILSDDSKYTANSTVNVKAGQSSNVSFNAADYEVN